MEEKSLRELKALVVECWVVFDKWKKARVSKKDFEAFKEWVERRLQAIEKIMRFRES